MEFSWLSQVILVWLSVVTNNVFTLGKLTYIYLSQYIIFVNVVYLTGFTMTPFSIYHSQFVGFKGFKAFHTKLQLHFEIDRNYLIQVQVGHG